MKVWRNPKYHSQGNGATAEADSAPKGPPVPAGETLVELERNQGAERLRVSRESFNGHDFIRCQVWDRGTGGHFWPVKRKAVTFKLRELPALVEALAEVAANGGQAEQDRPGRPDRRSDDRSHRQTPRRATGDSRASQAQADQTTYVGSADGFDEFGDGGRRP